MRHRELFCLTLQDRKQTSFNDGGGIMGLGNRRILRIHTVSSLSEEGSIAVNFGPIPKLEKFLLIHRKSKTTGTQIA